MAGLNNHSQLNADAGTELKLMDSDTSCGTALTAPRWSISVESSQKSRACTSGFLWRDTICSETFSVRAEQFFYSRRSTYVKSATVSFSAIAQLCTICSVFPLDQAVK